MTLYKKRVSIGSFLKKGIDIKDGDIVEIANEGKQQESQYGGMQDIFLIKTKEGKEGNVSFNQTSMNNMIDTYGEDSKNWIGKEVKVWLFKDIKEGKLQIKLIVSHPNAELTENGFVLIGKQVESKDIPVINAEEIDVKDIPF